MDASIIAAATSTAAITLAIVWARRVSGRQKRRDARGPDGTLVLRPAEVEGGIGIATLALFGGVLLFAIFSRAVPAFGLVLLGGFCLVAVYLVAESINVRVFVDENTIRSRDLWRRTQVIQWRDVETLESWPLSFAVRVRDGSCIFVSLELVGAPAFCALADSKLSDEAVSARVRLRLRELTQSLPN